MEKAQTLIELVKHYSPSGQESDAVNYLVGRMQNLGFTNAFKDEAGNAVGVIGEGEKQIVLLGHIDTVPGEIPVRVEPSPPAPLTEGEGGILYGRGSVDAKGPLSAFVDAVAGLGHVRDWQIIVIGAIDEERDSVGARFVVDQYQPEFAIIGEPSRWDRVTLGYKGSANASLTSRRKMAHSASGEETAPEAALALWDNVRAWAKEFNQGKNRVFEEILLSLRGFDSGDDGFESWASLQINARLPVTLFPEAWYSQLEKLSAPESVERVGFAIPAYRAEKNTPLVRAFLKGIRATGGKPGFVVKTGTADLNIVAPLWECPAIAYGPGDSNLDHTPNEHISLAEYEQAVAVLKKVLDTLVHME
ncbi:MAG: [LysW]-lysine hydrolase [Anaerolineales bacterium]|uniref:Putative [LysW]-lysine hydrolase n=1 Tax=Candidatus Desulfolinea nitratireducens TaxID=2841698 RepID=A0A8J6NGK9_9CHLR|nr:[LysW]-lysine hydrolase [Candidatus Desulfolinea nitratireducens]